jgi:hypothetical protein
LSQNRFGIEVKFWIYNPQKIPKKSPYRYRKVKFWIYNPKKSTKIHISIEKSEVLDL